MSNVFSKEVNEAASKMGGDWIKGAEFDGEGLVLQVKKVEKIVASNPKYGALDTDYIVKGEILEVGETFRYTFTTPDGAERKVDSKSMPMFIGFHQVEELAEGDWIKVVRTGKTDQTRYTVTKIEAPAVSPRKETPEEHRLRTGEKYDVAAADDIVSGIPF